MPLAASDFSPVVLNMPLASLLCREPWTGPFTLKAYRKGFQRVADLVGHTEDEIFTMIPTSAGNRRRIILALQRVSNAGVQG